MKAQKHKSGSGEGRTAFVNERGSLGAWSFSFSRESHLVFYALILEHPCVFFVTGERRVRTGTIG